MTTVDTAINGEIPVLPMTAADEIIVKNPDGLLNGHAVEKIIESCIPGIQHVRSLPTQDVDVILLAIKLASYGDELHVTAQCPVCKKLNEFTTSIRTILNRVKPFEDEYMVRANDEMVIYLKPQSFEASTKVNLASFEEMKVYQSVVNSEISDYDRSKLFNDSFEKIASLNLDVLADNIMSVIVPSEDASGTIEVIDRNEIKSFIKNTDRTTISKIREGVAAFKTAGIDKKVELECSNEECKHNWETEFQFDPSHFFD